MHPGYACLPDEASMKIIEAVWQGLQKQQRHRP
jgi:hypothetical protein